MTTIILTTLAIISASIHIWGEYGGPDILIYIFKPLTMVFIITIAILAKNPPSRKYKIAIIIGLLFSLTRKMANQVLNMPEGKWERPDGMVEMKGMTMGIIGLGGIGSQVARRARAMDMKVIAVDIVPKYKEQIGDICDEIRLVQDEGLEWLLPHADVIVSAAPHTKVSEGMMGPVQFEKMREGSYFINVSRGKLVQTEALLAALKSGHLAGAGLDVTDPEPLPSGHELWKLPNVIITSHIAAQSQYSFGRMQDVFVENAHRFVHGFPLLNQVNKEMGF